MGQIIWCDIDGVVGDLAKFFLPYLNIELAEDITYYDLSKFGLPQEKLEPILKGFEKTGEFLNMEFIEGAKEGINELYDSGREIRFLTGRDHYAKIGDHTKIWLKKGGIKSHKLICDRAKLEVILKEGIGPIIEDNPFEIQHLSSNGIPCICFDQSYNQEKNYPPLKETNLIKRVHNWKEVVDYIKKEF